MAQPTEFPGTLRRGAGPIPGALLAILVYGTLLVLAVAGWARYAAGQPSLLVYVSHLDFQSFYAGARLVWTGQAGALYDVGAQTRIITEALGPAAPPLLLPYLNPAWVALGLAPLGAVPYPTAYLIWSGINLALLVGTLARLAALTGQRGRDRWILGLALAGSMPVFVDAMQGQLTAVALLGCIEAYAAWRIGRPRAAGLWLLLGVVKPHLLIGPLVYWLGQRQWRLLATFTGGVIAVTGASLLALGDWLPAYLAYPAQALSAGVGLGDAPEAMINGRGLAAWWGWGTGPLVALEVLGGAALIALAVAEGSRIPPPVGWASALLLGLLITPHAYRHDGLLVCLAGCLLWRAGTAPPGARPLRALLAAGPVVSWAALVGPAGIGAAYLAILALIAGALALRPDARRYSQ